MIKTFFKSITLIECKHSTVVQRKAELIWRKWETRRQAEGAIFHSHGLQANHCRAAEYIDGFYNPRRRHSSLSGKSPLAFERKAA